MTATDQKNPDQKISQKINRKAEEKKIDEEVEESFPASDPPAFSAGSIGAPKNRESEPPASEDVDAARKKVPE